MKSSTHIQKTIERLLAQYVEYDALSEQIDRVVADFERMLLATAKDKGISLREVLQAIESYPELHLLQRERARYERMRDRVGDEMTFPTPEIWMRYKALAYRGTKEEIGTWGAFVEHCRPEGYICTKRFAFLRQEAQKHLGMELTDLPADTSLLDVCGDAWLAKLQDRPEVMEAWLEHEFYMRDRKVAKWQDVD